jgi:hypothetical protein
LNIAIIVLNGKGTVVDCKRDNVIVVLEVKLRSYYVNYATKQMKVLMNNIVSFSKTFKSEIKRG